MSISSEIQKIISNLSDCYTACSDKGATLPQEENLDNLATCISSITGGGGEYTGYKGYTVVGNPTISNGVISNFSADNFVKSPICWSADDNSLATFEIKLVFSITGTGTEGGDGILDTRCYEGTGGINNYWNSIRITLTTDRKIRFRQYDRLNSSWIFDFTGSTTLNTNTKYYLKATRTISPTYISEWNLTISTDDTTYTPYSQAQSSSNDSYSMACWSGFIFWGRNAASSPTTDAYLHGTLYIGECYIKAIDALNNTEYRFGSES